MNDYLGPVPGLEVDLECALEFELVVLEFVFGGLGSVLGLEVDLMCVLEFDLGDLELAPCLRYRLDQEGECTHLSYMVSMVVVS